MSSRSLNKVTLIGNLTRDPELRYTPSGAAVCTIGLATNRSWTTESGEKKEETEFHRVVAWNKLAELCSQLLTKGRKIYVEGRLRTNNWQTADGQPRSTTEVVIEDMILLDSKRPAPRSADENVQDSESGVTAGQDQNMTGQSVPDANEPASQNQADVNDGSQDAAEQSKVKVKKQVKKEDTPVQQEEKTDSDIRQDTASPDEDVNPDDIPF